MGTADGPPGEDDALLLDGTWQAAPSEERHRPALTDRSASVDDWEPIRVPGHWRSTAAFDDLDGPLLYRRRFETPTPAVGSRSWLVLDGIFYTSDVWFDGAYLGDTEGYFLPHEFEVTDALTAGTEHLLGLEVGCSPQTDRTAKRNLTGVFQHWDLIDQRWNPGGIWRSVRLERSGPVRIRHLRVLCADANERSATVFVRAVVDSDEARRVEVATRIEDTGVAETQTRTVAAGENYWEWTVTVEDPPLWWPWALGDQPLVDVDVSIRTTEGIPCDARRRRVGLRTVTMRDWIVSVNGERLFCKGTNQGPTRLALAEATDEELARDVTLAREAGLDLLRVHAHLSRPALYEAADRTGMLLWQDLPLQWGYARSVKAQARRQARAAVDLLGHHPSVALWCGHNEPFAMDVEPTTITDPAGRARVALTGARSLLLPAWNKTVLDHAIARVLRQCDGSRPVVPHSGVLPHPPTLDGTDTHVYFGWYHGEARQFPTAMRWWPRLARFVSEFGAQAVPDDADFCEPERWPDLDWDALYERHALQKVFFDRYVPPAEHETFDAWREATQAYQADVTRLHVETLRRLKYRPTGGFAQFCLADVQPAVTWSVLDAERRPKAAWDALVAACRPVVVIGDWLPEQMAPGSRLRQHLHVVSDRREPLRELVVTATATWGEGADAVALDARRWTGEVGADDVAYVATLDLDLPNSPGPVRITLRLDGPGVDDERTYVTRIG